MYRRELMYYSTTVEMAQENVMMGMIEMVTVVQVIAEYVFDFDMAFFFLLIIRSKIAGSVRILILVTALNAVAVFCSHILKIS